MLKKLLLLLALPAVLISCSSKKDDNQTIGDPKALYADAIKFKDQDQYVQAAEKFEQLEREHPASDFAAQAQIQRAYILYLDDKFEESVVIIDEFVKQYPAHSAAPYMFYLRGLCYYDRILDVGRDQELSRKAIKMFNDLINRFPHSKYARDAQLKIDYAVNTLAGKEMDIGRFYLKKLELIAALNRFKTVVDQYQSSIFIDEALYRMAEIYYALGDTQQANKYTAVLGYNYPKSQWYDIAYRIFAENYFEQEMPWYKKITNNIW